MAEEIKQEVAQETQQAGDNGADKVETRVDKRIQDLIESKNAEKQRAETLEAENKELKFQSKFAELSSKYPKAKDFQDKIKELVGKGYDVEDAVTSVLARNNALKTNTEIAQVNNEKSNFGGSADTNVVQSGQKDPKDMSIEELRAAIIQAEKNGEISIR